MDCEKACAGRDAFLSWLLKDGFPCSSHAPRWVRTKIGENGEIDLRDIARRELEKRTHPTNRAPRQHTRVGRLRLRHPGLRGLFGYPVSMWEYPIEIPLTPTGYYIE